MRKLVCALLVVLCPSAWATPTNYRFVLDTFVIPFSVTPSRLAASRDYLSEIRVTLADPAAGGLLAYHSDRFGGVEHVVRSGNGLSAAGHGFDAPFTCSWLFCDLSAAFVFSPAAGLSGSLSFSTPHDSFALSGSGSNWIASLSSDFPAIDGAAIVTGHFDGRIVPSASVPLPGTPALVALGLAAGWFSSRRTLPGARRSKS